MKGIVKVFAVAAALAVLGLALMLAGFAIGGPTAARRAMATPMLPAPMTTAISVLMAGSASCRRGRAGPAQRPGAEARRSGPVPTVGAARRERQGARFQAVPLPPTDRGARG